MKQVIHAASLCIAILLVASLSIAVSGCGPSTSELRAMEAERQRNDAWRAWQALNDGNKEQALRLIKAGADVRVKNDSDTTLLHLAATYNQWEVATLLLQKGADVNARDDRGKTPLHQVGLFGYHNTARVLLENGADVNAKDNDGKTPLDKAFFWNRSEKDYAKRQRRVELQSLLKRHGGR